MQLSHKVFSVSIIILITSLTNLIFAARTSSLREKKNEEQHRGRQKRFLVFPPNGGTGKILF